MSIYECLKKLRALRLLGGVRLCTRENVVSSTFGL